MANTTIYNLPALNTVDSTSLFPLSSNVTATPTTYQASIGNIGNAITGNLRLDGDEIGSTNDTVNIVGNNYAQLQSANTYMWVEDGEADIQVNGNTWVFNDSGYMEIPNEGSFGALNSSILAFSSQNNKPIFIEVIDTGNSAARQWVFDNSGNLTLPNGAVIKDTVAAAVAFGDGAGANTQGAYSVAVGSGAGANTQGGYAVAVGSDAGANTQSDLAVAIGYNAGNATQGLQAVAVGAGAGQSTQGNNSVAIGYSAGVDTQGEASIAIGQNAGNTTQGNSAVAIGVYAGQTGQGNEAVAIGDSAGQTDQHEDAVAIGQNAGQTGQGISSVAIGYGAGFTDQGNQSVAIGENAGANQGSTAIAIGQNAGGGVAYQNDDAVAIGHSAGEEDQGTQAIAIGLYTGQIAQGLNSIAFGAYAGQTNQGNNSIILNATGSALEQTTANTFTVKPVRQGNTANAMYYDASTGEITYDTAGGGGNTGNVTFNDINIIGTGNLKLQPDSANASSYLDIFLTAGPDIHIAGNGETVILGTDDYANVAVNIDGNVSIQAGNVGGTQTWTFGTDGILTFPTGNLVITPDDPAGNIASIVSTDHQLAILSTGANGAVATVWVEDYANVGTSNIAAVYANPTSGSKIVRIAVGQNGSPGPNLWDFGTTGILTLPQGSQISETANTSVNITANANTWAFGVDGNLTVPGSIINDTSIVLSAPAIFNICTIATAGSGYNTGSSLKATTGGSGTGMTVGIGYGLSNQLTNVSVVNPGTGYVNGDVITVSEGTGGTFVITKYNVLANQTNNNTVQTNLTFANNTLTLPIYGEIASNANMTLTTNYSNAGNTSSWTFGADGSLTFPDSTLQTTAYTGAAASVPSQNILPTIQSITISATSSGGSGGGSGWANVTVANTIPVTEYGVIVTAGTISQKYVTGSLGSIPGTVQLNITTGLNTTPFTVYAYVTSNAGTYYSNSATGTSGICLLAGTQIALSDGSYKAIEDINYTDKMLSWDFDRGCYAETSALWIKRGETGSQYNLLTFSDGTTLRTFDQHRIFNKQAGAFTYPMTTATPIGTITVNEHGQEITLINKQVIQDTIEYYNVITDYHMNLFSDSVLTSCRFNNIYPITDMKFVKDARMLRTRDEFENVEDRFFHGLRLAEQTTDIETVEWYVNRLLSTELLTQSELTF